MEKAREVFAAKSGVTVVAHEDHTELRLPNTAGPVILRPGESRTVEWATVVAEAPGPPQSSPAPPPHHPV
jgi:hypothetical protein